MKVSMGRFLYFQRRFIAFYICFMSFLTIMLYIEPNVTIHFSHILYIDMVSFAIFFAYLTVEYMIIKRHFRYITHLWENGIYISESFGEPKTYEQFLFHSLLQRINEHQQAKVTTMEMEKRDTLEYMTSWFHEIKTPISIIRLIMEQSTPSEEIKSLEEEINKIDGYVEQALYFVRSDDFHQDYFIMQTELDQLVRDVMKKHANLFIQKQIKLKLNVQPTEILTDQKWLKYVLSQIVSNALKYTPHRGEIKIFSEEDEQEVRLIILDNGIGIEKADLPRVFEKGFTGKNGRAYGSSTGMGLYLAQKLTRKLGHHITVQSEENKYTSVILHFSKTHDYYSFK